MFYKNSSIDFTNLVNENNLRTPLLVYDEEQLDYTLHKVKNIFSKIDENFEKNYASWTDSLFLWFANYKYCICGYHRWPIC